MSSRYDIDLKALCERLNIAVSSFQGTYPYLNPYDALRGAIADHLSSATGIDSALIYSILAWTIALDKGDLILPVPRLRNICPQAISAKEIHQKLSASTVMRQPELVNTSIKFEYNPKILPALVLPYIFKLGKNFGKNKYLGLLKSENLTQGKKRMIIEFSSPNIAKEFHVGHLRSTVIGAFLANLYEACGWHVIRMNYLGDWGRQFGLLAVGWNRYGNEKAFKEDPIAHLFQVYVKINSDFKPEEDEYRAAKKRQEDTSKLEQSGILGASKAYFKRMEQGDKDALALWNRFRLLSIKRYKETYSRLNIEFDEYSGESQVKQEVLDEIESTLRANGITEVDQNATVINFKKFGAPKLNTAIIRNRNGTSTYLLRDIGAAIQRWRTFDMNHMIYVIMDQQTTHVRQLFQILELMGEPYAKWSKNMQLVAFGKILGMSTRAGNVTFLNETLDEVGRSMHDVMRGNPIKYAEIHEPERIADVLGISSIIIQDMSGKRINTYDFDLKRMLSFEGDTGPYIQYAHARLCSISRRSGFTYDQLANADFSLLTEPHAINLVRIMGAYPDTVMHTFKTLEPATIVTYLFRLTHQLSSSYDVLRVIGSSESLEVSLARASLYEAARQVLWNGMTLLGLSPVSSKSNEVYKQIQIILSCFGLSQEELFAILHLGV